jgi:predicted nucleic acid-binding protein
VIREKSTEVVRQLFAQDGDIAVAWFTPVETASAIWRRWREKPEDDERELAIATLGDLETSWLEIDELRPVARRAAALFERHNLKAADALQLASGLVAAEILRDLPFVTCDHRLADAARAEGLTVIEPPQSTQ